MCFCTLPVAPNAKAQLVSAHQRLQKEYAILAYVLMLTIPRGNS